MIDCIRPAIKPIRPDEFSDETKDCTVRALSVAADISYEDAHAAMEMAGRKPKRGIRTKLALIKLAPIFESKAVIRGRITIGRFCQRFPKGRYLVRRNRYNGGHAFAVVDGIAYDAQASP